MLDDGQSEPGTTRGARTGLVSAIEAFEHTLLVGLGYADPPVGDGDLDITVHQPPTDRHGGARRGVRHRVVQQVRQRGDQQRAIALDGKTAGAVGGDVDAGRFGGESDPSQRLVHHRVDVHHGEFGQLLGALEPRQRDQFGHELAEPSGLPQDLLAESANLVGVVGGVEHRLGEHRDGPDRRFQLVTDVGHEVPVGGVHRGQQE